MQATYFIDLHQAHHHLAKVQVFLIDFDPQKKYLDIFLPAWSPGSYLVREYSRHISFMEASDAELNPLSVEKTNKAQWRVRWESEQLSLIKLVYEVYCHELTVRTSHIDREHAFLHGPTLWVGVLNESIDTLHLIINFPKSWQKVSTALSVIYAKENQWAFLAKSYDELLDSPLELGNHICETFTVKNKTHEVAIYGQSFLPIPQLIADIKTLVETELTLMPDAPYSHYVFIVHFVPYLFGGLEHAQSSVLQFDGRNLWVRTEYVRWLGLVAHEYFHTWNVKRIRPRALGPFDYTQENYTDMLWLVEGLTSFMDDLFVLRSGLCSLDEYLELQKENLQRYFSTYGRFVQSLAASSYDAWIKFYRPEENTSNMTVSYYLKGGLLFSVLNCILLDYGHRIDDFVLRLWQRYCNNPQQGMDSDEVLAIIEELTDAKTRQIVSDWIYRTEDIDFLSFYQKIAIQAEWETAKGLNLGCKIEVIHGRLMVKTVQRDNWAWHNGLNAGDELLAVNGVRVYPEDVEKWIGFLAPETEYLFLIARTGRILELKLQTPDKEKQLMQLCSSDRNQTLLALTGQPPENAEKKPLSPLL